MKNTVYQFLYNSNIHESGWITISLHYSKEGAEKAMAEHKEKEYRVWTIYNNQCIADDPQFFAEHPNVFAQHESWTVQPIEIKP